MGTCCSKVRKKSREADLLEGILALGPLAQLEQEDDVGCSDFRERDSLGSRRRENSFLQYVLLIVFFALMLS